MQDKKILFFASALLAFLIILPVVMAGDDLLFIDAGYPRTRQNNHISQAKLIAINWDALDGGRNKQVQLHLFDGVALTLVRDRLDLPESGGYVWLGHAQDNPHWTAALSVVDNTLIGTIALNGETQYTIDNDGPGQILRQVDPRGQTEVEIDDAVLPQELPHIDQAQGDYCEDGSTVDLLIAYTRTVRQKLGGTAAVQALINQRVSEMNSANINSGLKFRFNLVHTVETNFPETGNAAAILPLLRQPHDGMLDHIVAARDKYKADLVSLIISEAQTGTPCGIAYVMNDLTTNFSAYAYNVVALDYAGDYLTCSPQTLAHEIGHNLGNQHNREANSSPPLLPFAYGYQSPKQTFRTIMAYNCPGGCPRINYWSNPDARLLGEPLGVDYDRNSTRSADNSRSMAETALHVANFRENCTNDAVPTPTNTPPANAKPTATPPASSYPFGRKSYLPMIGN